MTAALVGIDRIVSSFGQQVDAKADRICANIKMSYDFMISVAATALGTGLAGDQIKAISEPLKEGTFHFFLPKSQLIDNVYIQRMLPGSSSSLTVLSTM